ncbi:VanZ like family protein [Pleurostoma richardsiae]|uniref:VanZ like family protein n=1 Tax=Pleurostoma richardsiae TaxID=41990 RepID=A0AA38RGY7_9PEZI|nr:VanZ like family protein [Pleurostoma richardsiae]
MRIRLPFAGVFFLLLLLAGYAGLTSLQLDTYVNDKVLHFATFFLLTVVFYWILDTNRRRALNLALVVCTAGLGLGSEILQALLPNGRTFDPFDVVANAAGSLAALALCGWYHKRMLERRRLRRYTAVPGGADGTGEEDGEAGHGEDLELGEGVGGGGVVSAQESGVTEASGAADGGGGAAARKTTLEEEVDNWDENAVDAWDEADMGDGVDQPAGGKGKEPEAPEPKKRTD